MKVWDGCVRTVHWSVAVLVLANMYNNSSGPWHRYAGYAAATLILARLAWGWLGTGHARFSSWPPLRGVPDYARALWRGRPPRHVGHNPLGVVMIAALWSLVLALGVTGWMTRLDAYWGEEWLENFHERLADVLLGCIVLHVVAVIVMSVLLRESLVRGMITGHKRRPD